MAMTREELEELRQAHEQAFMKLKEKRLRETPEIAKYYYEQGFYETSEAPESIQQTVTRDLLEEGMENGYQGNTENLAEAAKHAVDSGHGTEIQRQFVLHATWQDKSGKTKPRVTGKAEREEGSQSHRERLRGLLDANGKRIPKQGGGRGGPA